MTFRLLISSIVFLELLSFLVLFFGIILAMGYLAVKGIVLRDISYTLFLTSFILFFLFLSFNKGKKLLLILSFMVLFVAFAEKYLSSTNKNSIQQGSTEMNLKGGSESYKDLMSDNDKTIRQNKSQKFEDHFRTELKENWLIQNYSFPECGCEMIESQVQAKSSILTISVDLNKKETEKPYVGGEISSRAPFLYGSFTVRMKNQIAPGTVSSLFLMNKWRPEKWEHKEIDMEFLGKNTNAVQFTVHHYKNGGKRHIYNKYTYLLGFDSADDFHNYSIVWNTDSIAWLVDGDWVHSEKEILIDEEMYIRMNHWAAAPLNIDFIGWLGVVDKTRLPSKVYFDNVKYTPLR